MFSLNRFLNIILIAKHNLLETLNVELNEHYVSGIKSFLYSFPVNQSIHFNDNSQLNHSQCS